MVKIIGAIILVALILGITEAQLKTGFYDDPNSPRKCKNVEFTVRDVVRKKISQTFITVPGSLRLFFHDCMSTGCNAGVMIGNGGERDQVDNAGIAGDGFDTIERAKAAVEKMCPGKVSCADILALVARDVVFLSGGPFWMVETGRKDTTVSRASDVHLAKPTFNVDQLMGQYSRLAQLTLTDLVALSGAHTVGFTHCTTMLNRIWPNIESRLDFNFGKQLRQQCPRNVDPSIAITLDQVSFTRFDNQYYKNLIAHKGVLFSDSILFSDSRTRPIVQKFASDQNAFFQAWIAAMKKVGRTHVLTGSSGKIRRVCSQL